MENPKGFILYKIYYGKELVYLGRTRQPLNNRLRGHFFAKPMHKTISIELIDKIEYAEFQTDADMMLYEIYYINKFKPPINCDDKARDELTVTLPEVGFKEYRPHLMDKWIDQVADKARIEKEAKEAWWKKEEEVRAKRRAIRRLKRDGKITEDEYFDLLDELESEG